MSSFNVFPNDGKQPCIPDKRLVQGILHGDDRSWPVTAEVAWEAVVEECSLMGETVLSADWDPDEMEMSYTVAGEECDKCGRAGEPKTYVHSWSVWTQAKLKEQAFARWTERRQFLTVDELEKLSPNDPISSYLEPWEAVVLYPGGFHIESLPDHLVENGDRRWYLTLERSGWTGTLAELEKRLWEWAMNEGAV